jgi:hypothetical protein
MMTIEWVLIGLNVVVVISATVAAIAMLKTQRINKQINVWAKQALVRLEAIGKLNEVSMLIDEGKLFAAIDAIGLTPDVVDDMTMEQVQGAFAVRVADLVKVAKGENNG